MCCSYVASVLLDGFICWTNEYKRVPPIATPDPKNPLIVIGVRKIHIEAKIITMRLIVFATAKLTGLMRFNNRKPS
jgi:hypothetical protein